MSLLLDPCTYNYLAFNLKAKDEEEGGIFIRVSFVLRFASHDSFSLVNFLRLFKVIQNELPETISTFAISFHFYPSIHTYTHIHIHRQTKFVQVFK